MFYNFSHKNIKSLSGIPTTVECVAITKHDCYMGY